MVAIPATGAILAVLILNILPSVFPFQLDGNVHLLWVLMSLFIGVLVFKALSE